MVSEQDYPRQQMVWSDWCGWYVPSKPPKFLPALAADRPYSSSASARRPWPSRSIASSSSSLSGFGGGPYRQEMGVIGLGSSACKIPSRFQSESALEPYLPRQIPDSSDLRRRRGPVELALAVSGPDRREVKVPHSTPGKIPNPSSDLGKMKEWVVSYEEDASDPTAIWRVISATNYKADVGQHQLGKLEMARRVDDMRLINVRSTPEGNYNNLSTGFSVVVSGWGQDPLPCSSASSTGNHQNLSQEPASDRQWLQNPKENLSQPHSQYQAKQWDSNPSNKMVLSVSTDDDDLLSSNNMKIEQMEQTKVKANLCSVDYQLRKDPGKEIHEQEVYGIDSYKHNCLKEIMPADLDGSIDDKHAFIEVMIPELPEQERRGLPPQSGLLWNLPPWPDLSFCEVYWMAMSMEKGAGAVSRRNAYNVVAGQSKNQFQPMKNKVKGAVEFCDVRLSQVRNLLGKITYDPKSCTWMSGVNVINLDKGRKHNVTDNDLLLLEKFKTKDGVTVAKSLEVEDKVKLVSIVKDKESMYALAMNDTGPLLVSGGTESVVRVWDPGSESKNMKWGRIETSGHMLSFNVVTEDNVEVVSSQAEAERQWMQISVKSPSVGKNIKLNVKKSNSAADVKCCYTVAKFLRPGVIVKHYKESAESSVFWFSFGGKQSYTNKNATQDISVREPHLYAFSVRNRGLEELKLQLKVFFSCVVLRLFRSRYGTSYQQHEVALEALVDFCRQKKFMVEIYSKMDCDLQCSNVFENLANLLSKSAFPVNSPLFSLNVLALNKLVIQAIAERINNAPKHYVQTETVLNQALGENFFDPTTKKWTTKNTVSATCKRGFIQSYYEPIKQIIKTCMNDQKDKLWPMLRKLGVTLKIDEKELMGKTLIKCVMQTWLPASNAWLEMFLNGVTKDGVRLNCTTYTILVHGYSSLGQWAVVVITHGIWFHGNTIEGALVDLHALLELMAQNGISLNHHIFNILIYAYGKYETVDKAIHIFNKVWQQRLDPDIVVYATVIDALCRVGRVDDVMFQFNLMIDEGLTPDIIAFSTLVNGLCTCDKWEEAEELALEMMSKGIHSNAVFFKTMMGNLCKDGRLMEARNIFDLMVRVRVMHDVLSYSTMIYGYCLCGKMAEVMKLLDSMFLIGLKYNAFTHSTLLEGYWKDGRLEGASALFKEVLGEGIHPGVITYSIMLEGLSQSGRTAAAKQLFKSLKVEYNIQRPEGVGIHLGFHDSQLKVHCGSKAIFSPDLSLVSQDSKLKAEPISVLENSVVTQWLIPWENLPPDDVSWDFIKGTFPAFYLHTLRYWFLNFHT